MVGRFLPDDADCGNRNDQVSSRLELFTEFYARNNRAYLLLDGSWDLDGFYYLNGYKTENMDLYPVRLRISG